MKRVLLGFSFVLTVLGLAMPAAHAVQLNEIVAGFDRAEGDIVFPLRVLAHSGEMYLEPVRLVISPNCAKTIRFADKKAYCAPDGDTSREFVFATVVKSRPESDSSWVALFLEYDPGRVKFVARLSPSTNEPIYYLLIK